MQYALRRGFCARKYGGGMIRVVAAVVERGGRLLICQRRRGGAFALKWEFPGGKMRAGETPWEALTRELREELGVAASIGRELYRVRHSYAEVRDPLQISFFAASMRLRRATEPGMALWHCCDRIKNAFRARIVGKTQRSGALRFSARRPRIRGPARARRIRGRWRFQLTARSPLFQRLV